MSAQFKDFEANIRQKYGNLKTVKSFLDLTIKAYDDNLDGLLKFLDVDNETLEANMLTEMNEESVSEFVNEYGINPEILLRLLTNISDSFVEPLVDGYYDKTNDFGEITNSKIKKKKKKKAKKGKPPKSQSQKKKVKPKKKPKDKRAQTNALNLNYSKQNIESFNKTKPKPKNIIPPASSSSVSSIGRRGRAQTASNMIESRLKKKKTPKSPKTPTTPKTPKSPKTAKKKKGRKTPTSPKSPKSPKRTKSTSSTSSISEEEEEKESKQTKIESKQSNSKLEELVNLPTMPLDEEKEASETEEIDGGDQTLDDYLNNYYFRLIYFDGSPKQSLTYPLTWSCLFYHQMGADLEFDALEDVMDEKERIDILWNEWNEKKLSINKTEYDSDDNKANDNEDEDALLTEVPDFVYDFYKDIDRSFEIFSDNKTGKKHEIYVYRIRRWISGDLQEEESKEIPKKFRDLPRYSWIADKISYLNDYIITDDLVVIQDCNLLSTPTWFKWLDNNGKNGLNFIRNSGFFKNKNNSGIYSLLNDGKVNLLENGICGIGDFKIGIQPNDDDLDLYGIIRLDVLTPSLFRFPFYKSPVINIGKSLINDNIISPELDCKLPIIQNNGLCFDNIQRYEKQIGNKDVAVRIDLKPLIINYNKKRELDDIWTLYISFAHPMANKKDQRSTILFKKNCIDLSIENKYDDKGKEVIKEELVLKIFSKNSGSRFIEIFRKKIKSNSPTTVNSLIISYGNNNKIFCSLNGRQLTLSLDTMSRTNLFNLKKSSFLLLGHKCTSGDTGSTQNLFNGYLFQFAIFPKWFHEFELRSFQQQCQSHIKMYCKMLENY